MAQNTETSTTEIYTSRQVLLTQMKMRGYDIDDYSGFSENEINTMRNNNQLDMLLTQKEDDVDTHTKQKVYVHYYLAKTLRTANLTELIDELFHTESVLTTGDNLYIVIRENINDTMLGVLRHIWEHDGIFVVLQQLQRLQSNKLEHILVPKYEIMSNAETEIVKKQYNIINDKQWPDLTRFDPVAQALCIRPGQVCRITRPSKTAILSYYYRIIIN